MPLTPPHSARPCWHLVCRVIDNFGDVGVMWRLARQLHAEWNLNIRFFIDQPDILRLLAPDIAVDGASGSAFMLVHLLDEEAPVGLDADVVICGFQTRLPAAARSSILSRQQTTGFPRLIQLDYLSAEAWIDAVHGLPSRHPDGLLEYFFNPGFGPDNGGLLLERTLFAERDAFLGDPARQRQWLTAHGIRRESEELLISALCYASAPLAALLQRLSSRLAGQGRKLHLLLPGAHTQPHLEALDDLAPVRTGQIRLTRLPFLPQPEFDRLLWCCDLNLVRGEDSWIRALWSGRPWLWQAYPQSDAVHLDKLHAFLVRAEHWLAASLQADAQTPSAAHPQADISAISVDIDGAAAQDATARMQQSCAATSSISRLDLQATLNCWQNAMLAWNQAPDQVLDAVVSWMDAPGWDALPMLLSSEVARHAGDLASRLWSFAQQCGERDAGAKRSG